MITLFQILQLLIGIVMWTLIAQGLLVLMLRDKRFGNPAYKIAAWITRPVMWFTRAIVPKFVIDAHIGLIAFFLLLVLRLGLYMFFYSQGWIDVEIRP